MTHQFTPKEKSLRKQWLVLSLIAILAWPIITLGFLAYLNSKEPVPKEFVGIYLAVILVTVGVFYALYRCAYKKPGIRFLTFCLILGLLLKIQGAVSTLKQAQDSTTVVALIVNLAFYAWWFVLSLKLRKMNKAIQSHQH